MCIWVNRKIKIRTSFEIEVLVHWGWFRLKLYVLCYDFYVIFLKNCQGWFMKNTDFLTSNIHVELIRVLAENRTDVFFKSRLAKRVISNASNRHVVHDKEYTKPQAQFLLLISIATPGNPGQNVLFDACVCSTYYSHVGWSDHKTLWLWPAAMNDSRKYESDRILHTIPRIYMYIVCKHAWHYLFWSQERVPCPDVSPDCTEQVPDECGCCDVCAGQVGESCSIFSRYVKPGFTYKLRNCFSDHLVRIGILVHTPFRIEERRNIYQGHEWHW